MKNKKIKLILLLAITNMIYTAVASAAPCGGVSGCGGGNTLSSDPADVVNAVKELQKNDFLAMGLLSEAQTRQLFNPAVVNDPDLKKLFRKFSTVPGQGNGGSVIQDMLKTKLNTEKRCAEDGETKDATTYTRRSAPICINGTSFARHPKENLPEEISIVIMHELSHHFGANEPVAYKFQNYMTPFVREFLRGRKMNDGGQSPKEALEMRPGGFVDVNINNAPAQVRCGEAGASINAPKGRFAVFQMRIEVGQRVLLGSGTETILVSCKSLPTVECKIEEVDGKRVLSYGATKDYWSWIPGDLDARLKYLQNANICTKELGSGENPREGDADSAR